MYIQQRQEEHHSMNLVFPQRPRHVYVRGTCDGAERFKRFPLIGVRGRHARIQRAPGKVYELPLSACWGVNEQGEYEAHIPAEPHKVWFPLEVSTRNCAVGPFGVRVLEVKRFQGQVLLENDHAYLVRITNRSPRFIGDILEVSKEHVYVR